jgi:predicted metal-dependent enzyme (double-stranded beta helix superfamily)
MGSNDERMVAVETATAKMKAIEARPNFGRADLAEILEVVKGLAAQRELWSAAEFPPPAPDARQARYLIREDPDHRFALYLNIMRRGNRTPIHNHTTWACIAAVEGTEHNYVYKRLDDGSKPGYAEVVENGVVIVRPGAEGIALMPDDIHAVEIHEDDVIRHLHMYGLALEELHDRVAYDPPNKTYKKMEMSLASRRAT